MIIWFSMLLIEILRASQSELESMFELLKTEIDQIRLWGPPVIAPAQL